MLQLFLPMIQWRVGCSGFHYEEWRGLFYPLGLAKSKWFEFYCEHFNTIELNNTFYRFPKVQFLRSWHGRSPADFKFSVKAPRLITHFKKLKDAQQYLSDFYSALREGLQEKMATVLFQFPSNFQYDGDRLDRIINLLDASFRNIVEFRHTSWWNEKVFEALTRHNITFSGMSHPSLPQTVVHTNRILYYRFHGVPHLYTSKYEMPELEQMVHDVYRQEDLEEVYVYFNNTAEGAAITNAKQLLELRELVH